MILIFVDETSDSKLKNYFGLSCAVVKHNFYKKIKEGFQNTLIENGWNPSVEFKGSYLFSASRGCLDVSVETRVEITKKILELNVAQKNARMSFFYLKKQTENEKLDYLRYLPALIDKVLSKPQMGQGKDLITIQCDYRQDISSTDIREVVEPVIRQKNYTLVEDIIQVTSNFNTVGIAYADIVGYLVARIDTITNDSELFENIPPELFESNGKIKKLRSSLELISLIKNLSLYQMKE